MRELTCLLLLAFTCTAAAADEDRIFGPFRFGMTPEEARAASPDAPWTVLNAAKESGRIAEIRGTAVLELGGFRYDLKVGSQYGGSHHWEITSTAATTDAAGCESRAAALIGALEDHFGTFESPGELVGTEETVSVGKASRMKTDASGVKLRRISRAQDAARYYVRARHVAEHVDDLEVVVLADYEAARGHECDIRVRVDGNTPPPPGLRVTFDPARVLARPTISYRNRSLRDLGVPASPREFIVQCALQAADGTVGTCISGPAGGDIDPYRKLASQWALSYRLDIGAADADDRTMYPIEIPISMGAAEVREVDLMNGRLLDLTQIKVVRGARVDPSDYFPADPELRKSSADLLIRCQVQEDGSMICGLKPGSTSPAPPFISGAIRLAENLEIEPTLRDGSSAVGGLIERRVQFKAAR
jgi:hypothetical protein